MVKSYLHAFISMKYLVILPAVSVVIFILAFAYFRTKIMLLRILVFIMAAVLAVLLAMFYGERFSISGKLRKIRNWKEYNDSYIIGQAFLLEDRMLIYDRKIREFYYRDLKEIRGEKGKKDNWNVYLISGSDSAMDVTSSKGQAQRLAAFLKARNSSISLTDIEAEGDGILAHVESGK
ncbi:MAG: hypothetical protein K6D03_02780 [Solobacterium sp.]|nr:hypothetical protein [Solobacterium sp.]